MSKHTTNPRQRQRTGQQNAPPAFSGAIPDLSCRYVLHDLVMALLSAGWIKLARLVRSLPFDLVNRIKSSWRPKTLPTTFFGWIPFLALSILLYSYSPPSPLAWLANRLCLYGNLYATVSWYCPLIGAPFSNSPRSYRSNCLDWY